MSNPIEAAFPAIREFLSYDPTTGHFIWIKSPTVLGHIKAGTRAGCMTKLGYISIGFKGRNYLGHRLAWHWMHGETPDLIDHINNRPADNRIANLRPATKHQNAGNQRGRTVLGKGVKRASGCDRFVASIKVNGREIYLGIFKNPSDARAAYAAAAREHFGEFARIE